MAEPTVRLKILRQDGPDRKDTRRWEEFELPLAPRMNVVHALQQIQRNPVTKDGKQVAPVAWECSCLDEVCGACTMIVNGRVRQACSAIVEDLAPKGQTLVLEPMSKFPLVRDLMVDRSRMFEDLKRVHGWIDLDGTHELGAGPREGPEAQQLRYALSRCMTCGCCLEACPNVNDATAFMGPAVVNQVRYFNLHASGNLQRRLRLEALMGQGGIADCGKAQNCVEVCPKEIPLVDSLSAMARETTKHLILGWFLK